MRILATVLIAAITLPASAQETRASASAKFKTEFSATDSNRDGVLTKAEVKARIARMKIGKGNPDAVHAQRLADLWFGRADANADGKVTLAESEALLGATFDRYDANHDGKVGGAEQNAAKADAGR